MSYGLLAKNVFRDEIYLETKDLKMFLTAEKIVCLISRVQYIMKVVQHKWRKW